MNCLYRNCGLEIPDTKRIDAKYCNKKCRMNERTYLKREKKKELELKNNLNNILHQYQKKTTPEELKSNLEIVDLYNKIYK